MKSGSKKDFRKKDTEHKRKNPAGRVKGRQILLIETPARRGRKEKKMKMYRVIDTNEICSEEEIRASFEHYKREPEIGNTTFEDYLEHLLDLGRQKVGGIEPAKWYAVQETGEDAWDYGSYDYEEAVRMLKEQGHGQIAVIDKGDFCEDEISYEEAIEE